MDFGESLSISSILHILLEVIDFEILRRVSYYDIRVSFNERIFTYLNFSQNQRQLKKET